MVAPLDAILGRIGNMPKVLLRYRYLVSLNVVNEGMCLALAHGYLRDKCKYKAEQLQVIVKQYAHRE